MRTIQVIYDLRQPGQYYNRVWEYLRRHDHAHPLQSMWLIRTPKDARQVIDDLIALVDGNDRIFTFDLSGDDWWARSDDHQSVAWMHGNMQTVQPAA